MSFSTRMKFMYELHAIAWSNMPMEPLKIENF